MQTIGDILDRQERPIRTIFISSYIPRKCGIATYTKDLTNALNDLNPQDLCEVVAVDVTSDIYYPWEVKYRIERNNLLDYFRAAEYVSQSTADAVCFQHEFGLYGGDEGDYIFEFLENINKPIISTLHTVLEKPEPKKMQNIQRLAKISKQLVVMIPYAKEILVKKYKIESEKIVVIPHGVTDQPRAVKEGKQKFGWQDSRILLSSGLLNRGKGCEYVIEALPEILEQYPETKFVILGQTHPVVLQEEGEKYRESLIKRARELGVSNNVIFVNKYLPLNLLLEYYEACDIFLTTHLEPQQISSGTLAYAIGMGKVCVSTPYKYAKEFLDKKTGILVRFRSSKDIAKAAIKVFGNSSYEEELSANAYRKGRMMCWPRVAQRYLNLFRYNKSLYELQKEDKKNFFKAFKLFNR